MNDNAEFAGNEMSHDDTRRLLQAAIQPKTPQSDGRSPYVVDTYPSSFVYRNTDGKLYRRSHAIGPDMKVTMGDPQQVVQSSSYKPVGVAEFTVWEFARADKNTVTLKGKVFEVGTYPDKQFSIDETEMDNTIAKFNGVALDFHHLRMPNGKRMTEFLGKPLGTLGQKLFRKGKEVFGEVTVPKWLADLTGNAVGVSLDFAADKKIQGCALTIDPYFTDARVQAAFSASSEDGDESEETKPAKSGIHGGKMKPSIQDRVMAWFGLHKPEDIEEAELKAAFAGTSETKPTTETKATEAKSADDASAEFDKRFKALEDQNRVLMTDKANALAVTFANDAIATDKFDPSDREGLTDMFTAALKADGQAGQIAFSAEGVAVEGNHCQKMRKMVKDRTPHKRTLEVIHGDAKFSDEEGKKRREAYFSATDSGRQVLAGEKKEAGK